jgi:hypothetical protein
MGKKKEKRKKLQKIAHRYTHTARSMLISVIRMFCGIMLVICEGERSWDVLFSLFLHLRWCLLRVATSSYLLYYCSNACFGFIPVPLSR